MAAEAGGIIGGKARLEINTGTSGSPTWKKIIDEVKFELKRTNEKVQRRSKDTGKHNQYIKTFVDTMISITALDNPVPGSDGINFFDIEALSILTNADSGGGVKEMRILPTVSGLPSFAFDGFIENVSMPYEVGALVEYTFDIQVNSLPTTAEVA